MLEHVLKRISSGGMHSLSQLARELDVSEDLLEQALLDLERMGYLRRVGMSCEGSCAHCPSESGCAVYGADHLWTLTDKKLPI